MECRGTPYGYSLSKRRNAGKECPTTSGNVELSRFTMLYSVPAHAKGVRAKSSWSEEMLLCAHWNTLNFNLVFLCFSSQSSWFHDNTSQPSSNCLRVLLTTSSSYRSVQNIHYLYHMPTPLIRQACHFWHQISLISDTKSPSFATPKTHLDFSHLRHLISLISDTTIWSLWYGGHLGGTWEDLGRRIAAFGTWEGLGGDLGKMIAAFQCNHLRFIIIGDIGGGTWGDLGRRIAAFQCNHLRFIIRGHRGGTWGGLGQEDCSSSMQPFRVYQLGNMEGGNLGGLRAT